MRTLNMGVDRGNERTNVAVPTDSGALWETDASSLISTGDMDRYQALQSGSGLSEQTPTNKLMVEYEDSIYFLSDFATNGKNPTSDFKDKHRYHNKRTKVSIMCFAALAASQIWPDSNVDELSVNLVMGVPLRAYREQASTIVEELTKSYRYTFGGREMAINIETVKVLIEGAGAAIYNGFDKTATIGIVDSGSLTTNVIRFDARKPNAEQSDSFEIGVNSALDLLNTSFERKYSRELTHTEMQQILRASIGQEVYPEIYADNTQVSGLDLHKWIKSAIDEIGSEKNSKISALWSNQSGKIASSFKEVLHCGGGTYYFHSALQKIIKKAIQIEDPEKANARGYALLAGEIGQRRILRRA
jgi:hypothetical protein